MCRMCAFTGDEEAAQDEARYLSDRRALLFSGTIPSLPSAKTHYCRNDEEYGYAPRPWRVTHDGGYTEWWCASCFRYLRVMVSEPAVAA
jgi:hypothetical protein